MSLPCKVPLSAPFKVLYKSNVLEFIIIYYYEALFPHVLLTVYHY